MELLIILFGTFFALAFLGVPVAYALGSAAMLGMLSAGVPLTSLPQKMFTAIDSFSFMAIPFFILAGKLMELGGISKRLVRLADALLSKIRGGLAIATIVACAFFAALSGSAPGTVAAIGSVMYPEMKKLGYDEEFEEYFCEVNLDEDEMEKFLTDSFQGGCPYYRLEDEYRTVRKQM